VRTAGTHGISITLSVMLKVDSWSTHVSFNLLVTVKVGARRVYWANVIMNNHTKLLILTWLAEQVMDYTVLTTDACPQELWNNRPHKVLVVDDNEELRFANWNQVRWWMSDYWDPFTSIRQASGLLEATELPYEWGRRKFVLFTQVPELGPGVWDYACVLHCIGKLVYAEVHTDSEELQLKGDDVPLDIRCLVAVRAICKLLGLTDDDWKQIGQTDYLAEALARIKQSQEEQSHQSTPPPERQGGLNWN